MWAIAHEKRLENPISHLMGWKECLLFTRYPVFDSLA